MAVAFPHRQLHQPLQRHPFQGAFGIAGQHRAAVALYQENKPQPVLAIAPEAGPADGGAQAQLLALDAGFLADFAAEAGHHILVTVELAAQAVVLSQVLVIGAGVAVDHQHLAAIRRKDVAHVATIGV